jgi:hypothetical protein
MIASASKRKIHCRTATALTLSGALFLGGCFSPAEPLPTILWQGSLEPVGGGTLFLSGSVAMVANDASTQIGIGVDLLDAGVTVNWVIREGSCTAPGVPVASPDAFPSLTTSDSGRAEVEVRFFQRINTLRDYIAQLSTSEGGPPTLLACGSLERRNASP